MPNELLQRGQNRPSKPTPVFEERGIFNYSSTNTINVIGNTHFGGRIVFLTGSKLWITGENVTIFVRAAILFSAVHFFSGLEIGLEI